MIRAKSGRTKELPGGAAVALSLPPCHPHAHLPGPLPPHVFRLVRFYRFRSRLWLSSLRLSSGERCFRQSRDAQRNFYRRFRVNGQRHRRSGEPAHAGNAAAKSVWWQWTAPQSGRVSIDTFGSAIDTVVAIYRGTTLSGLTAIAFNDEAGGTHASAVSFYAGAGFTYCIAVDGYQGASGNIVLRLVSSSSADLYATDFESFTIGGDRIIGTDGWSSTHFGGGSSGIVQSAAFGSRAAYVGLNPTADALVSVWRPVGAVPVMGFTSNVQFSVDLAVIDSTPGNGKRDAFFFILYNASGQLLAALNFDNAGQRIYRYDGATYTDVGAFVRGTRYTLTASINFDANTWSAALDGTPLFSDRSLHTQGRSWSLGFISASWLISTPGASGDNCLVFDNYRLTALNPPAPPVVTTQPVNVTTYAGSPAVFRVQASGTPAPTFEWEVSTDGGTTWAAPSSSVLVQTPGELGLLPHLGMSGYLYRCVVTNAGGRVVSSAATLTVNPIPERSPFRPAGRILWWP